MSTIPREHAFLGLGPGGFHRVAYLEWGDPDAARTAVCVHGLTRNARDFDPLARALADAGWRVVCPDVVGRGRSDRLADPMGYVLPQYVQDMVALIARLDVGEVDWVGTSMGGLIGMLLASRPNAPIRRMVLNDIGPFVPKEALAPIAAYVGLDPTFRTVDEVERHLRLIHAGFGQLSAAQWRRLAETSSRPRPGGLALLHDPAIVVPMKASPPTDIDLWDLWDRIPVPVLVMRGAESPLLTREVADGMARRGPGAEIREVAGAGHAPSLMVEDQISVIREFLRR
jgi:pimeloyl-ACP methyl ester carboxylesterase